VHVIFVLQVCYVLWCIWHSTWVFDCAGIVHLHCHWSLLVVLMAAMFAPCLSVVMDVTLLQPVMTGILLQFMHSCVSFLGRFFDRVDLIKPVWNVRPCVRTSVCPQKVPSISVKFGVYVEVDEWCTTVCSMTDPRSWSRALQSWKYGHFQQLSPPPFTMGVGSWPLILKLRHNI